MDIETLVIAAAETYYDIEQAFIVVDYIFNIVCSKDSRRGLYVQFHGWPLPITQFEQEYMKQYGYFA